MFWCFLYDLLEQIDGDAKLLLSIHKCISAKLDQANILHADKPQKKYIYIYILLTKFCFQYLSIAKRNIKNCRKYHISLFLGFNCKDFLLLLSTVISWYVHLPFCNSDPFLSQKASGCGRGMQKVQSCSWVCCVDGFHYHSLDKITVPGGVRFTKGFMKEAKVLGRAFLYVCV
jgi:hypothetical protein